jgi:hypothetical protein
MILQQLTHNPVNLSFIFANGMVKVGLLCFGMLQLSREIRH